MLLSFGYDKTTLQYNLPDENLLGVLLPNETPAALTGEAEVKRALQNPIGTPRLSEIVRPGEKIAIVTSDITRPMPTYAVLPHVQRSWRSPVCGMRMSPLFSPWASIVK